MTFNMKKRYFFPSFDHSFATICSLSNVMRSGNMDKTKRIFSQQQCSAMNKKNAEHDDDEKANLNEKEKKNK